MRRVFLALIRALLPQRVACHACGAPLMSGEGLLCEDCEKALQACALPGARVETVLDSRLNVAASVYHYQTPADTLVKALKFGNDQTAALPLAQGMALVYANLPALRKAEVCVAVPSHFRRQRRRGYNQAEVLAGVFSGLVGLPLQSDILLRIHHKHSQIGRNRTARFLNVTGAFAANTQAARLIAGRSVLLIDDVLTTGVTATDCARALLDAGAKDVQLLTACRV